MFGDGIRQTLGEIPRKGNPFSISFPIIIEVFSGDGNVHFREAVDRVLFPGDGCRGDHRFSGKTQFFFAEGFFVLQDISCCDACFRGVVRRFPSLEAYPLTASLHNLLPISRWPLVRSGQCRQGSTDLSNDH